MHKKSFTHFLPLVVLLSAWKVNLLKYGIVYFIRYAYALFPPPLSVLYWRGEFLLCTVHSHPPSPSIWGGRFDYMFYYILYDNTINYVAMSKYFHLRLFYCVLCGCCVCVLL